MMESFFLDGEGSKEYETIRDHDVCAPSRAFIEKMWPLCSEFLDSDIRQRAPREFHQRWWEVYLTYSLLSANVQLVNRNCRKLKKSGPDLLARLDGSNLWIEAVAALPGVGPDAIPSRGPSKGPKPFPEREIMLRFQQAFSKKVCAHARYVKRGWVSPREGYIIALNGALGERGYPCMQRFPRIVNTLLLGVENERVEIEFNEKTSRFGESQFEYQPEIEKRSKASVRVAAFHDYANSCVSAVLYSASDAYMVRDLVLVLNPHAQVPLPPDFLSQIPRYWAELRDESFVLYSPQHAEP
jgi:hypothetical protein